MVSNSASNLVSDAAETRNDSSHSCLVSKLQDVDEKCSREIENSRN